MLLITLGCVAIGWVMVAIMMVSICASASAGDDALEGAIRASALRERGGAKAPAGRDREPAAGSLAVGPEKVVQLVEAGDGWLVAEGAVWSAAIVEVQPAG